MSVSYMAIKLDPKTVQQAQEQRVHYALKVPCNFDTLLDLAEVVTEFIYKYEVKFAVDDVWTEATLPHRFPRTLLQVDGPLLGMLLEAKVDPRLLLVEEDERAYGLHFSARTMVGLFQWYVHVKDEYALAERIGRPFRVRMVLPDAGTPDASVPKVALPYNMAETALEAQKASYRQTPMEDKANKTAQDFVRNLNARQITFESPHTLEVHAFLDKETDPDHVAWIRCVKDSASSDLSMAFAGIDMKRVVSQSASKALDAQFVKIGKTSAAPSDGTGDAGPGPQTSKSMAGVEDMDDTTATVS